MWYARTWWAKTLGGAAVIVVMASMAVRPCRAQWPNGTTVVETVHNLARTAQVPPMSTMFLDYGSACVYCHTPHGGGPDRPLWNRQLPATPYRMYESNTIDMIADPQPTEVSLLCLSCHDGTIGLDEIANPPPLFTATTPLGEVIERCATDCHTGGNPDGGINWENVWFDDDLRTQHPISILYDPSLDPDFNSVAAVEAAGLRLYGGKVQCGTCHDPHTQQFAPFLRMSNGGQALCSTCHLADPGETTAHFW